MAAVSIATLPPYAHRKSTVSSLSPFPVTSSLPFHGTTFSLQIRALAQRTESEGAGLLRRPTILSRKELGEISEDEVELTEEISRDFNHVEEGRIDWERQILQETAPLVNFVRTILHSDKYANGDKLDPGHEKIILDKLLPFHPEFEDKIGCGVDYLTVDLHPDYEGSRCLFIVRKDGEEVDFSYRKCIKGLITKNYPIDANSFIFRHFRIRRLD